MNGAVFYKGTWLAKNSDALAMYEAWQKATANRNQLQAKLDKHLKELDQKEIDLIARYSKQ